MRIVIIGAGAAGCFAAIEVKRRCPEAEVTVLEKGTKPLAKVAITGGGRCNLTNSFAEVKSLEQVYSRGFRLMKKLFHHFSPEDAYEWFEREGVRLVTQDDECVFPQSQDAMEIVNKLIFLMNRLGVKTLCGCKVTGIAPHSPYYVVTYTKAGSTHMIEADKVIVTTGGHPSASGFDMLKGLDLEIVPPVPSLFSLCIADKSLTALMGTVVEQAQVSLAGTKIKTSIRKPAIADMTLFLLAKRTETATVVTVKVKSNKVTSITIESSREDSQYMNRAKDTVIGEIIDAQSLNVQTVSGATMSSNGIIEAVANALGIAYTNQNSQLGGRGSHRGH